MISWAESIGLSEYAPNLKESGVHGGSIALDNDFDCEKLALALKIPPTILEVGSCDLSCDALPMLHVQCNTECKVSRPKIFCTTSGTPLVDTPEIRTPLYQGDFAVSQICINLPQKCGFRTLPKVSTLAGFHCILIEC